jgi:hypothetical protein
MTSVRQQIAFPTVAKIRKGTPKKYAEKNGNKYLAYGDDLKNKFRVEFLPGTDTKREDGKPSIRETWHNLYSKEYKKYDSEKYVTDYGYEMSYVLATLPTLRALDGFHWSNATYNGSGMKIAEADDSHYLMKKDPVTMETLIHDGQPFEEFNVGQDFTYEKDGKKQSLKLKSSARLSLFIPSLGEMVAFELRTSSYYDSLYMQQNLMAIQQQANMFNNGVAGGIPLDIYRVEVEVPYMQGGKARKSKQWFIQIKINSEWAKQMMQKLSGFAMAGTTPNPDFNIPFTPPELPSVILEETDDDEEEGVVSPEQIVEETHEEVTEVIKIETKVLTSDEWADKLAEVYNSLKGDKPKRKEILDIFATYVESKNMRLEKDIVKLEECYNKIMKTKIGEK